MTIKFLTNKLFLWANLNRQSIWWFPKIWDPKVLAGFILWFISRVIDMGYPMIGLRNTQS